MNILKKITHPKTFILFLLVICFAACGMMVFQNNKEDNDQITGHLISQLLQATHYNQIAINDEFSKNAFKAVLDYNDPSKRFLLKSDIIQLKKHENKIDEYYQTGDMSLFNDLFPIITKREEQVIKLVISLLQKEIELKEMSDVQTNPDSLDFCENEKELIQRWKANLLFMINERIYQQEKKQEEDSTGTKKTLQELEKEAREYVLKKHQEWFDRMSKIEREDRVATYLNALISIYCPHTQYFPPKDKEDFDIEFSGKLEGIGATLSVKEGYIHVEKIVPGSASWKAGELEVGDVILEVAQGNAPPVDVYDMRLDKAVRLIRGPKGTEVRLTIKKITGESKVISIIRDVVIIEETYAKSLIIQEKNQADSYGYIHLESFYADFNNTNGRRCSKDVLNEIKALKKSKVKGLILDLRNNGGGSLTDAIEMAGYFIKAGPIVQVDGVNEAPKVYSDYNPLIQFELPLVVLVNEYSASASEIFAAAIQDYKRGLVVGTNTYGKGTVQRFYPLEEVAKINQLNLEGAQLGEVKETIAKFFRINGGATQLKGVKPDVILPDNYLFLELGEGSYPFALEWKAIAAAEYDTFQYPYQLSQVAKTAQQKVDTSAYFKQMIKSAQNVKWASDMTRFPINYQSFKQNKLEKDEKAKTAEVQKVSIDDWLVSYHVEDSTLFKSDTLALERMKNFKKIVESDRYVREAVSIISLMR